MAEDYIKDLHMYDEAIIWDEDVWSKAIWDARFIVDGGIICGFVITNEICYKKKNNLLYIAEFYISPDERRRRVGIGAAEALTADWNGDVYLYILSRNVGGKAFWGFVEKELGWKRIERPEIKKELGCELRVFDIRGDASG